METTQKMIEGVAVSLGGEDYIIPPLNLSAVRRLLPKIESIVANPNVVNLTDDMMDSMLEIILTAMKRNYPDMSREKIEDLIDLANMKPVIAAVLGTSGFERTAGGRKPGEAQASQSIST